MADDAPDERRDALTELDNDLTRRRFTGSAVRRTVSAIVDGHGTLRELAIDGTALRGRFPEQVGQSITEAVLDARRRAGEESMTRLGAVLDPKPVAQLGKHEIDDFEQVDFVRPGSDG